MASSVETCSECGKTIKGNGIANVFDDRCVCTRCYKALSRQRRISEAAASAAEHPAVDYEYEEAPPGAFFSKIAGVTHCNDDGTNRQDLLARCNVGEFLRLVREPANPVDFYAICVCRCDGTLLGYIPRHSNGELARQMDSGGRAWAEIKELTGGTDDFFRGANIIVHSEVKGRAPPPATRKPSLLRRLFGWT